MSTPYIPFIIYTARPFSEPRVLYTIPPFKAHYSRTKTRPESPLSGTRGQYYRPKPALLSIRSHGTKKRNGRTHISPRHQHKQPNQNNQRVQKRAPQSPDPTLRIPPGPIVRRAHAEVRDAPEDKAEEGVEQAAHERQQIREERNHLRDDERQHPRRSQNACPAGPADDGVVALVARALEDAEEDEARGHGSVQDPEEDEGRDHEGEGDFLVQLVAERAEGGRGVVLRARVSVNDGADEAEEDDFRDRDGPERLGEVGGVLHLGDEAGERDLPDEGVADVQEGAEAVNEGSAGGGDDKDLDGAVGCGWGCRVRVEHVAGGGALDGCENGR